MLISISDAITLAIAKAIAIENELERSVIYQDYLHDELTFKQAEQACRELDMKAMQAIARIEVK